MSTYERITAEYSALGATDSDCMDANDNALMLLQDAHGYESVTAETLIEGGKFYVDFVELYAASLEGVFSEGEFGHR